MIFFPPVNIQKTLTEKSSCGTDADINGPGPYRYYNIYPDIVEDMSLIIIYKMPPLALPWVLYTVVANDVSKLSMINTSGDFTLPTPTICSSGSMKIWCQLKHCPYHYCSIFNLYAFIWSWGSVFETVQYFATPIPVFRIIDTLPDSPFVTLNLLKENLPLVVLSFTDLPSKYLA